MTLCQSCVIFSNILLVCHLLTNSWRLGVQTLAPNFMCSSTCFLTVAMWLISNLSCIFLTLTLSRIWSMSSSIPRPIVMTYFDLQNEHFKRSKYVIISNLCAQCYIFINNTHIPAGIISFILLITTNLFCIQRCSCLTEQFYGYLNGRKHHQMLFYKAEVPRNTMWDWS